MATPNQETKFQSVTAELQLRVNTITELGNTHFTGTNLIKEDGSALEPTDEKAIVEFLLAADPPNKKNVGRHEHIRTTMQFAEKLAIRFGKDPTLMRVLAALHDAGSVISQDAIVHDDLWKIAAGRMGIRKDVMDLLHSPDDARQAQQMQMQYALNDEEVIERQLQETPVEKKLLVLADMCGKRFPMQLTTVEEGGRSVEAWDIITWEHTLDRHIKTGNKLKAAGNQDYRLYELDTIRYKKIYEWAKSQGVDVDEIRNEIKEEESRATPSTVLIDMGNVAMLNPNPAIYEGFSRALNLPENFVISAFSTAVDGLDTGTKSESEFWRLFELALGQQLPANYRELFTNPLRQKRNPTIDRLIPQFKSHSLQVGAFTDTVPSHKNVMREEGLLDGMDFVVASCDTNVTKSGDPKMAAKIAAAYAGYKPHQALLLFDDRMDVSQAMHEFGVKVLPYDIRNPNNASLVNGLTRYNIQVTL